MTAGEPVGGAAQDGPGHGPSDSDTPTPPTGLGLTGGAPYFTGDLGGDPSAADVPPRDRPGPETEAGDMTPPTGTPGVVGADGVIDSSDFGRPGPVVLGGDDPVETESHQQAQDWPKLEYRSRNKPKRGGALGWMRRQRDSE